MGFNLTFLIGNGFDINMGLKTSYKDFYNHIRNKYSNSSVLYNNVFFERINKNIDDWQDFEKMMGILTCFHSEKDFFKARVHGLDFSMSEEEVERVIELIYDGKSEINYDTFYTSLEFFVKEFQLYVIEQQNLIINSLNEEDISSMIYFSLTSYWKDFDEFNREWYFEELSRHIQNSKSYTIVSNNLNDSKYSFEINVNFLNFNYTSTLEKMLSRISLPELENFFSEEISKILENNILEDVKLKVKIANHHVHATTKTGMFLGVDNQSQINQMFFNTIRQQEQLIKPERVQDRFSSQLNQIQEILDMSDLVYVYGMSLGETDKTWWKRLITKIKENTSFKVVIHSYSPSKSLNISELNYDKNVDEIKDLLLKHDDDYYSERIDRNLARRMRGQVISIMTSKILFQKTSSFFWTVLDAIEFFENTMFEDNNYHLLKQEFKNYSPSSWLEENNEGNIITLSRKNIDNDNKKYYVFIHHEEFVEIQFYGQEIEHLKHREKVLKVDKKTYLANEIKASLATIIKF